MIKKLTMLHHGDLLLAMLWIKKFLERFMKKNAKDRSRRI